MAGPAKAKTAAPAKAGAVKAGAAASGDKGSQEGAFLVSAKIEGFRRAGRAWSKGQTLVGVAELSEDQLAALLAEPMLTVTAQEAKQ